MMALSGVRSSWLMVARNCDLAWLAAAAASSALVRFSAVACNSRLVASSSTTCARRRSRLVDRAQRQFVIDDAPPPGRARRSFPSPPRPPIASHCGCHAVSGTMTVGSGVRVRADIAVKCRPAIATHSRLVPLSTARQPDERVKTRNATAPATTPMTRAAWA